MQGSVVVFGAWANWTDDYDEYIASGDEKNYCMYTPMMTAFVILILKWVRVNKCLYFDTKLTFKYFLLGSDSLHDPPDLLLRLLLLCHVRQKFSKPKCLKLHYLISQ